MIETDSLLMKRLLDDVWEPRWNIVELVEEINELRVSCVVEIAHVLREGNQLADHLVNVTLDNNVGVQVPSFEELDIKGRNILNSDKLQLPYIRVRNAKPNSI